MELSVQFKIDIPIRIKKRARWYVASCPVLDVHSQGETTAKARKNLSEALSLFLTSCFERGTLDAVLKECGFRPDYAFLESRKHPTRKKEQLLAVPIPFVVEQKSKLTCHG